MSVNHYENFPVASLLCPPALRPAVVALYHFARTADDLADEGEVAPAQRLADLAAYRHDLAEGLAGRPVSARWAPVFQGLLPLVQAHRLPVPLLTDLLSAFEQDVVQQRYGSRAELLDYCRRSANPVGRLLLHLHGVQDKAALARSDAICTALQLINFWQDLGVDTRRGRIYPPADDCQRHGVDPQALLAGQHGPAVQALVADLSGWARRLMQQGAPLVHQLPGRAGWELRLVVQGGLRVLDKLDAARHNSLLQRPRLFWFDLPGLLWAAARMGPQPPQAAGQPS